METADAARLTDFYGLQALACRAMLEGGKALVRLRYRRPDDGLPVALTGHPAAPITCEMLHTIPDRRATDIRDRS